MTTALFNQPTSGAAATVTTVTAANLAGAVVPGPDGHVLTAASGAWTSAAAAGGLPSVLYTNTGVATAAISANAILDSFTITGFTPSTALRVYLTYYVTGGSNTATVAINTSGMGTASLKTTALSAQGGLFVDIMQRPSNPGVVMLCGCDQSNANVSQTVASISTDTWTSFTLQLFTPSGQASSNINWTWKLVKL